MANASVFINRCLLAIAHSHALHFDTQSHAKHKALGKFYKDLEGLIDTFAEAYIGADGIYTPTFDSIKALNTDPIIYIHSVVSDVDVIYDLCGSNLKNILDEIKTLCYQTIYRLKQTL